MLHSMHAKYLFCRFQKRESRLYPLQKTKFVVPTYSILFSGCRQLLTRLTHLLTPFYIIFCIYYWTCSCSENIWNPACLKFSNNQSINLTFGKFSSIVHHFNFYYIKMQPNKNKSEWVIWRVKPTLQFYSYIMARKS